MDRIVADSRSLVALENTVKEWQSSRFARDGVQCQGCHMPDRKHEIRGIHESLLDGELDANGSKLIKNALKHVDSNDYLLYEEVVTL